VQEAASVWEKVLVAKGGRDRLHSIESVLRSSRIPSKLGRQSFDRQVEELFVFPSKYWQWANESPTIYGRSGLTLDFESKTSYFRWETDKSPRISVADPKAEGWRFEFLQALELLETRRMRPDPVRTWSEEEHGRVLVLVECKFPMTNGWASVIFTIDSETFLPSRAMVREPLINDRVVRLIFDFSDYVSVDGIQMPRSIRHSGDDLHFDEKLNYQFNVDYEPNLFKIGPTIEDGPEGWKRRR
jgi:hypothetical protein